MAKLALVYGMRLFPEDELGENHRGNCDVEGRPYLARDDALNRG